MPKQTKKTAKKRPGTKGYLIRMLPREHRLLKGLAANAGMSFSEFCMARILAKVLVPLVPAVEAPGEPPPAAPPKESL